MGLQSQQMLGLGICRFYGRALEQFSYHYSAAATPENCNCREIECSQIMMRGGNVLWSGACSPSEEYSIKSEYFEYKMKILLTLAGVHEASILQFFKIVDNILVLQTPVSGRVLMWTHVIFCVFQFWYLIMTFPLLLNNHTHVHLESTLNNELFIFPINVQ